MLMSLFSKNSHEGLIDLSTGDMKSEYYAEDYDANSYKGSIFYMILNDQTGFIKIFVRNSGIMTENKSCQI